jgi:Flp pilus assembly pilin Flp
MSRLLRRFIDDQNGGTALEYVWIASLISIAALTAIRSIHTKMQSWFWPIANNLQ